MPEFQGIGASELGAGRPVTASLMSRLANNPQAVWEADPSAPKISVNAVERWVNPGGVRRWTMPRSDETGSVNWVEAVGLTLWAEGRLRFQFVFSCSNQSVPVYFRLLRSGAEVVGFPSGAPNPTAYAIDVDVWPGAYFSLQHHGTVTGSSSSRSRIHEVSLLTEGQVFRRVTVAATGGVYE